MQTLILRTIDGDDTLSVTEHPCADARALLSTLAQIMPLMGLLGTVLGMMQLLIAIDQKVPLVQAGDLAVGIWQALVSTATGIAVAILAYAGHSFLVGRVESIVLDMERAAGEIVAHFTVAANRLEGKSQP